MAVQSAQVNVIRFPGRPTSSAPGSDQKGLLDTIYTMGAMVIASDDRTTKQIAARLQVFGFLDISEISMDGTARRLKPSETAVASDARPWRLSKPAIDAF